LPEHPDITVLLKKWHAGDHDASEEIFRLLMPDLKRIAARSLRRDGKNPSLQRTELVNEAFFKLAEANRVIDWRDRGHFFAISTIKMRFYLIDRFRKKPKFDIFPLEDLPEGIVAGRNPQEIRLAVDRLLNELEKEEPMICAVVVARAYIGYENKEISENFSLPLRTVERYWHQGRRWLFERLSTKLEK